MYYAILAEQILEQSMIPFRFVNYWAAPIQKFFWNSIPRHLAFVPGISTALEDPALMALSEKSSIGSEKYFYWTLYLTSFCN